MVPADPVAEMLGNDMIEYNEGVAPSAPAPAREEPMPGQAQAKPCATCGLGAAPSDLKRHYSSTRYSIHLCPWGGSRRDFRD